MYYNNLNGCAKIRTDIRWSISSGNKCVPSSNYKGDHATEAICLKHLTKKVDRHSCKEGVGCVAEKWGQYKNYSTCVEGCTLWDCSTGSCMKSPNGEYESKDHCKKKMGYDCSNGCSKLVCGGGYNSMEGCMSDCSSWNCKLGSGCSVEPGKHTGEEGYFGSKIDCNDTCMGSTCTKIVGCQPNNKSTTPSVACAKTCTLWSCSNGTCAEDPNGVFTSKED